MLKKLLYVVLIVFVVVAGAWVGYQKFRPHVFHGMVVKSQPAPDFELTGAGGRRVHLHDFQGKVVLLYFGYTFCPDVCPTTMRDLAQAMKILGPQKARQVQVIMISVDPLRDTPDRVDEYVHHFDPHFIGLTGTEKEIAQVATLYGIYYHKHEGTAATGYIVDHTATVTVVDQKGYIRLLFTFGTTPEQIADDLAYMLR